MNKDERNFINEIKEYDGVYTYVKNVKSGILEDNNLRCCISIRGLKITMTLDKNYTDGDVRKVDHAVEHLKEFPPAIKQ